MIVCLCDLNKSYISIFSTAVTISADLQFVPVDGDVFISVRSTLFVLHPHDVESLVYDDTLGHTSGGAARCCPLQVDAVSSMARSVVAEGGAAAGLLVVDHHPVLVGCGGGSELCTGHDLDVIQTQSYCTSLRLVKVAATKNDIHMDDIYQCQMNRLE